MRGKHCEARSRFRGEVKARLSEISGQYLFPSTNIEIICAYIMNDDNNDHDNCEMTTITMVKVMTM